MNKYGATKGAPFPKEKAQLYGEVIERIEKEQGRIIPETVVDEARQPSCPLHNYFDWNNTTAAQKYRLFQARALLNHLTVIVNVNSGEEQKAFFSVTEHIPNDGKVLAYVNIERALGTKELRQQVLKNALNEIVYWEKKYKQYSEFKGIIKAIRVTVKQFYKKK